MNRTAIRLALLLLALGAIWAAAAWPRINDVQTGRTPEYPDLRVHDYAATPEPTEIAGRYQVVQKLGAGAFGTVYKVRDKLLKRMLAIKTIRLEGLAAAGASLEEMLDRFRREAEVSAQLKHPNIVTIYDIGVDSGMSYLAMEFIDGTGLDKMIQSGKLSLERAASLGAQVADALDCAHQTHV